MKNQNSWEVKEGITYANGQKTAFPIDIDHKELPSIYLVRDKDWNIYHVVVIPYNMETIFHSDGSLGETYLLYALYDYLSTLDLESKVAAVDYLQDTITVCEIGLLQESSNYLNSIYNQSPLEEDDDYHDYDDYDDFDSFEDILETNEIETLELELGLSEI